MAVDRAARAVFFAVVPAFLAVLRAEDAVLLAELEAALRVRVAAAFCAAVRRVDAVPREELPLLLREDELRDDDRLDDELPELRDDEPLLAARDELPRDAELPLLEDVERREDDRRRVVPELVRRSAAGTSWRTTSPTSVLIWRPRNVCIRSSSRRKRLASEADSRSPSFSATAWITS